MCSSDLGPQRGVPRSGCGSGCASEKTFHAQAGEALMFDIISTLRWAAVCAVASVALYMAYEAGGESWRHAYDELVIEQRAAEAEFVSAWTLEKSRLEAEVSMARQQARIASRAAEDTESSASERIAKIEADAKTAPIAAGSA